jgi:PLP dependent protein
MMESSESARIVAENLARVRERLSSAAHRAGRPPDEITLIAVTKYVDASLARQLVEAGCHDLGESRPQELWRKAELLADLPIRWHLIGHLQKNKLKRTVPLVSLIHAGDSRSLLDMLERAGEARDRPIPVLLEVNVSEDTAKHGFAVEQVEGVVEQFGGSPFLDIRGLMAMAGRAHQGETARADFRKLRLLAERLRAAPNCLPPLEVLSMGMSGDLEEAIAEGATMVRVGSALFEGVGSD